MTRHIPPILSRPRRILLDLILYIIAFILAVLFLVPDAESADKGTLDEFFKDKCVLCDCSKHFDEDKLKAALEEGMRAALEER